MMTRFFRISVARGFVSSIVSLSATLLPIWLISPLLLLAAPVGSNQRTVTKLAEGIYLIRHKNAPDLPKGIRWSSSAISACKRHALNQKRDRRLEERR